MLRRFTIKERKEKNGTYPTMESTTPKNQESSVLFLIALLSTRELA